MKQCYINHLKYSLRYSEYTTKGREYVLNKFGKWLDSKGKAIEDPENIKIVDVYNFIEDLSREGWSVGSCVWFTDGIKGYLRYCRDVAELDIVDYHKIKSPKTPERKI